MRYTYTTFVIDRLIAIYRSMLDCDRRIGHPWSWMNQILSHSDVLLIPRAMVSAALETVALGINYSIRLKCCKEYADWVCVCVCVSLLMACGDKYHRWMTVPPVWVSSIHQHHPDRSHSSSLTLRYKQARVHVSKWQMNVWSSLNLAKRIHFTFIRPRHLVVWCVSYSGKPQPIHPPVGSKEGIKKVRDEKYWGKRH